MIFAHASIILFHEALYLEASLSRIKFLISVESLSLFSVQIVGSINNQGVPSLYSNRILILSDHRILVPGIVPVTSFTACFRGSNNLSVAFNGSIAAILDWRLRSTIRVLSRLKARQIASYSNPYS